MGQKKGHGGFQFMDKEKQREIAGKGGRAAHALGTAHEFNSETGKVAGRKGGKAISADREHMSKIGRRGGERNAALRKVI